MLKQPCYHQLVTTSGACHWCAAPVVPTPVVDDNIGYRRDANSLQACDQLCQLLPCAVGRIQVVQLPWHVPLWTD
jgi:hypothetical protein